MQWKHNTKKSFGFAAVFLFVATGTYNAVVINSDSNISSYDVRFEKRLDEVYGVITPGRMVAAATTWKKLTPVQIKKDPIIQVVKRIDSAPAVESNSNNEVVSAAAIQEELELNLAEVINPKKWQNGLKTTEFSGSMTTNNGSIEGLEVSLPNGEGISVSFSEMSGNVFEYDLDGEVFSGMMYQVDQSSYMITLTNGPLEGTRLKFVKALSQEVQEIQENQEQAQEEVQTEVVENEQPQVEAGNFGEENPQQENAQAFQPEEISQYDKEIQEQAAAYNLEQQQT